MLRAGGDGASYLSQLQSQMQYDAMRKQKQKEVRVRAPHTRRC